MAQGGAPTADLIGYLGKATQWGREIYAPVEQNGAVPVNIQDQHTPAFDIPFAQAAGAPTTLTVDATLDAWSVSVTTGHGFIAGDQVLLQDPVGQRAMHAYVISVVGDNTVNLDTPTSYAYRAASTVIMEVSTDLNVNGAGTRQVFRVGTSIEHELDITRIMFQMTTTTPPEFSDFGDIALGLSRGLVCRVTNGLYTNLWNVKSNADLALLMFDVNVYESDKQFQVNGLAGRLTYGGQAKHGVTIRLGANEFVEVIIQDDLTSLLSFRMSAAGHLVTD